MNGILGSKPVEEEVLKKKPDFERAAYDPATAILQAAATTSIAVPILLVIQRNIDVDVLHSRHPDAVGQSDCAGGPASTPEDEPAHHQRTLAPFLGVDGKKVLNLDDVYLATSLGFPTGDDGYKMLSLLLGRNVRDGHTGRQRLGVFELCDEIFPGHWALVGHIESHPTLNSVYSGFRPESRPSRAIVSTTGARVFDGTCRQRCLDACCQVPRSGGK